MQLLPENQILALFFPGLQLFVFFRVQRYAALQKLLKFRVRRDRLGLLPLNPRELAILTNA